MVATNIYKQNVKLMQIYIYIYIYIALKIFRAFFVCF